MKYMLKKITTLIITLLLVSVVTFVAFSVIPGDPALAKLGTYATPERVEALREEMGLNKSLPVILTGSREPFTVILGSLTSMQGFRSVNLLIRGCR